MTETVPPMSETEGSPRRPPLLRLLRRIPDQVSRLIRDELRAARIELTTKLKEAGVGIGLLAGAAIIGLYLIGTLIAAAILGLATALPAWLAALIVAAALLVVAAVLALVGLRSLKSGIPPLPEQTIDSLKADIRTVKGTNS